jgi:hypothetical protein
VKRRSIASTGIHEDQGEIRFPQVLPAENSSVGPRSLEGAYRRGDSVCIFPQNIVELWNVSTRPVHLDGLGLSLSETERNFTRCEAFFALLPETPAIFQEWRRLVVLWKLFRISRME